jgi:hypothetical protein
MVYRFIDTKRSLAWTVICIVFRIRVIRPLTTVKSLHARQTLSARSLYTRFPQSSSSSSPSEA